MRFLGLIEESQREWLTGTIWVSNSPKELVNQATLQMRNYQVARANGDDQLSTQSEQWFRNNQFRVVDGRTVDYQGTGEGYIEGLLEQRRAARARRDWKEADRLRDSLAELGVVIKDSKEGTKWELRR
jgi:cysteinyl-tRNA synthetase